MPVLTIILFKHARTNKMKKVAALAVTLAFVAPAAFAYQVTGPVVELTDTKIVVQKDKEKWEISRDKDTKVTGDLKKGSKVTIEYKMSADKIEVKDAGKKDDKKPAIKK
jgi:hypothetical protein